MSKALYLAERIRLMQEQLDFELTKESIFGTNDDYETGAILVWEVADGNHTVSAVKHSSGSWCTTYINEGSTYSFDQLIDRIADRPCYIMIEMQRIN